MVYRRTEVNFGKKISDGSHKNMAKVTFQKGSLVWEILWKKCQII